MTSGPADTTPVSAAEFAALMTPLDPFETAPHLAVAVSGGADSVALALLADAWARARGGRATALTVDHGLRAEAAAEAERVASRMAARGIAHHTLVRRGPAPKTGIQAAAREARYALMSDWCREAGVLHLLVAHHRRDQAETVVMRLARGAGVDGLAGMAAVVETPAVRIVRPLLALDPARLRATVAAFGEDWIDEASNADNRFERVRVRRALPALAAAGASVPALVALATRMGRARTVLDAAASDLLGACVRLDPAGYAVLDRARLAAAPDEVSIRALGRVVAAVGGRAYGPSPEKLERLHARVVAEAGAGTLGGCRAVAVGERLVVCREVRGLPGPLDVAGDRELRWDGRFVLTIRGADAGGVRLAPLGAGGWREVAATMPEAARSAVPVPVRPTLPALFDAAGVTSVPHVGFRRAGPPAPAIVGCAFRPRKTLGNGGYFLA